MELNFIYCVFFLCTITLINQLMLFIFSRVKTPKYVTYHPDAVQFKFKHLELHFHSFKDEWIMFSLNEMRTDNRYFLFMTISNLVIVFKN